MQKQANKNKKKPQLSQLFFFSFETGFYYKGYTINIQPRLSSNSQSYQSFDDRIAPPCGTSVITSSAITFLLYHTKIDM